jgi:hypothetical protein
MAFGEAASGNEELGGCREARSPGWECQAKRL